MFFPLKNPDDLLGVMVSGAVINKIGMGRKHELEAIKKLQQEFVLL